MHCILILEDLRQILSSVFDLRGSSVLKCYRKDLQTASSILPTYLYSARTAEPGKAGNTYISKFPGADMDLSSLLV